MGTLSFILLVWTGTTRGTVIDEIWIGRVYFCPVSHHILLLLLLFLIQHATTPVPSRQRNCFTDCDSSITWWQQSNFHMNNYPAVRVGSSFISIWWTRRIVLTKAASRGHCIQGTGHRQGTDRFISAVSCLPGLIMPAPWKLAHEPSVVCSPNGLWESLCIYTFISLLTWIFSFFIFACFDVTTCISGTRLSLIRNLGCSPVYWSVTIPTILLSPSCQLDSWAEKIKTTDVTHAHNTFECFSAQTHSSTKPAQPLTWVSLLIGQSLNKQRKVNSVWAGAAWYHFAVLTVLCPPPSLQLDAFVWIQLANVKNLIKWPGREKPLSGANGSSNIPATSRHLQDKSSSHNHINTAMLQQTSIAEIQSKSLNSQTNAGSVLWSWLPFRAVVGGRPAYSLVLPAFREASVVCYPWGHLLLQAHSGPLMCSRLGNTRATIKPSGRPPFRKESITHLIGFNDFSSPTETLLRNEDILLCGLVGFWGNTDAMVTDSSPNGNSQKMVP